MSDTPKKPRTRKPKATKPADKPILAAVPVSNVVANDFTAKLRERSVGGLSDLLGIDRSTINKWIKKHRCPTVREAAGRGAGNEWVVDIAAVWAWHAQWQREQLLAAASGGDVDDADADLKLLKLAQLAAVLVPVDLVVANNARFYAEAKQSCMAISGRVARTLDGFPADRVDGAVRLIDELHADMLTALAANQAASIPPPSAFVRIEDDDDADRPH